MIVITESQLWSRYREFLCVCACHSIIVYFTDVINFIGYVHLTITFNNELIIFRYLTHSSARPHNSKLGSLNQAARCARNGSYVRGKALAVHKCAIIVNSVSSSEPTAGRAATLPMAGGRLASTVTLLSTKTRVVPV